MKGMKFLSYWSGIVVLLIMGACCTRGAYAQNTNSGDIRGTVTDNTGALIPSVTVTVLNIDTGVSKDYATNQDGLFDTSSIVPGHYTVTFTKQGFETLVRGPVTLNVGYITVDASLKVGSTTTQVTVSTDVPLLQTESGSQTVTLESRQMAGLPLVNQDFAKFMILLPGTTGSASNAPTTTNPGMVAAADGNLPYTNILNDGVSMVAGHSDNVSTVGEMDAIGEMQISESSFSAEYGVGGLVINKITKSGTSKFHGDAYEYAQNNFFNSRRHNYSTGPKPAVPILRYDDFGGAIGGPILKKKMFFFFNYDQILQHGGANTSLQTIPTADIMGGDFSSITRTLYDPTTQTIAYDSLGNPYPVRESFTSEYGETGANVNTIPSGMIDTVANAVQAYYPTATSHPSFGTIEPGTVNPTTGVLQNNWYTSLANTNPFRSYTGRLDYDVTPNNRITYSMWMQANPTPNLSNLTACPLGCQFGFANEDTYQVTDVWNISPSVINEARMGYTWAISDYPDSALNKSYASMVGWQFGKADQFPSISGFSDYSGIGPASNSDYKQGNFDPSDVVTMIRGKNVLHFGGELLFFREDDTNWGNINAGSMSFDGRYTTQWTVSSANCPAGTPSGDTCAAPSSGTTGFGYADFLLGLANNWNAAISPEYGARMKDPEMFVQDDYKMRPNLTINIGLRYDISHGWNEIHGNEMLFDPTVANPAGGLGALWFATTHANGRKSLQANVFSTFLPRLGFSWQPWSNTTVRGGFGVYDHIMTLDDYSVGLGNAFAASGNISDTTSGITPVVQLDGTGTIYGTATPLPYVSPNENPAALNGQSVGYSPFHTPIQKIYEYNFAVQRQLLPNLVAQIAYVGSHSWNLPVSSDLNAVPATKLSPNDTIYRPYPLFGNLSSSTASVDGVSNYNSLQAEITQRVTAGLSFSFNYVWSQFLDDEDSAGWCCQAGVSDYQIPNDSAANYGNSNFNIHHAFKGYAVYELPFGKGKQFLNNNSAADAVIGGWQLSGSLAILSGSPFSVYADGNTYNQASGSTQFPNWNPGVSWKPAHRSTDEWFNPAAFTKPANGTYGNVKRNSLYGPGWYQVNLSGSKTFSLPWEGVKFQIRIDAYNAFNHTSWAAPGSGSGGVGLESPVDATAGTVYSGPTVGQITSSTVTGRIVQLGGRLSF
jgi:hypothetical protein